MFVIVPSGLSPLIKCYITYIVASASLFLKIHCYLYAIQSLIVLTCLYIGCIKNPAQFESKCSLNCKLRKICENVVKYLSSVSLVHHQRTYNITKNGITYSSLPFFLRQFFFLLLMSLPRIFTLLQLQK
jgi:hypothetical protein